MSDNKSPTDKLNLRDLWTLEEILKALKVENVTGGKVLEIVKVNPAASMQVMLEEYISKFNPDLYELHQKSTKDIVDYSQYKNFRKFAFQKKVIIDGFIKNNFNLYASKWVNPINDIISIYYSYFILCDIKSSNFKHISSKGIIMESFCKINNENICINNKPQNEGIEGRGIHLITMNNINGNILKIKNFDVYGNVNDGRKFQKECNNIFQNNFCLIFVKDSAENYSRNGLIKLKKKYKIKTKSLKFREPYICIFKTDFRNNSHIIYESVGVFQNSIQCKIAIKLYQHRT